MESIIAGRRLHKFNSQKSHKWLGRRLPASLLIFLTGFAHPTEPPLLFPCWGDRAPHPISLPPDIGPGLLIPRPMPVGDKGPAAPFPDLPPNFSLSFLFFLQITRSPGWVKWRASSGWPSSRLLPSLDSLWGMEFLILVLSTVWMGTRVCGFWKGPLSESMSFTNFWRLLGPAVSCREDGPMAGVETGAVKDMELLDSRKSISENATPMISKKRSWTFLASDLTCYIVSYSLVKKQYKYGPLRFDSWCP